MDKDELKVMGNLIDVSYFLLSVLTNQLNAQHGPNITIIGLDEAQKNIDAAREWYFKKGLL